MIFVFFVPQVEGTTERPRLCVFRSNKHLYVQVIDDTKMHTLASASTMQKPISEDLSFPSGPTIVSILGSVLLVIRQINLQSHCFFFPSSIPHHYDFIDSSDDQYSLKFWFALSHSQYYDEFAELVKSII